MPQFWSEQYRAYFVLTRFVVGQGLAEVLSPHNLCPNLYEKQLCRPDKRACVSGPVPQQIDLQFAHINHSFNP